MPVQTNEPPHKLCPSAGAIIFNERREVLLQLRGDDRTWAIPGGHVERGESVPQTVIREVREETGLDVEIVRLVGVYSRPDECTWKYEAGDVTQFVSICFECRVVGGSFQLNDESLELRYFPTNALPESLRQTHRRRIEDAVCGGPATWNG